MKKIILIIVSLLVATMCIGCENKKDDSIKKKVNQEGDFQFGLRIANSDDGSYLIVNDENNNYFVSFYDKNADQLVPLCQKTNCEHKDMNCSAYQLARIENNDDIYMLFSIIYHNEKLYLSYIPLQGNVSVLINSVKKDGSGLKTEYRSSEIGLIHTFSMYKDKFIISKGFIDKDESGNYIGSSTINDIVMYDPDTKEETIIANENKLENCMVYPIAMIKNKLYYANYDTEKNIKQVVAYDLNNKTSISNGDYDELINIIYNKNLYYINENNEIMIQNLLSKKVKKLLQLEEKPLFFDVSPQGYLSYTFQNKVGNLFTQVMDLNTNKAVFKKSKKNIIILGRNEKYYFIQGENGIMHKYDIDKDNMVLLTKQ